MDMCYSIIWWSLSWKCAPMDECGIHHMVSRPVHALQEHAWESRFHSFIWLCSLSTVWCQWKPSIWTFYLWWLGMESGSKWLFLWHISINKAQDIILKDLETHGAMFVPITLGSDKTTASTSTGQVEYWPPHGSIGNIHNNIQHAHGAGLVLIGCLSIPKSTHCIIQFLARFLTWPS